MPPNPFLLAADNPAELLPLLDENPGLASQQDDHGYSLLHAAASYNHLDLLRALVRKYGVDVNLRDEDDETALFVVETLDAAKVLVEDLDADVMIKGADGYTAHEKIFEEGDYPDIANYLRQREAGRAPQLRNGAPDASSHPESQDAPPPLPDGLNISVSTITTAEADENEADPEFRRRIEELAERDDFHTDAGQAELRQLVQDALAGDDFSDRNVRPRQA
ncbi:ankyrin repeat-containing protein [Xylariaceae sp. FL1019]|nr:ankyrin repeat-containing protein [Xylariaceae sp. FL1019]